MKDIKRVEDKAGLVEIDELVELTEVEDPTGGVTPTVIVTATIGASAALCPTTKCSSKC